MTIELNWCYKRLSPTEKMQIDLSKATTSQEKLLIAARFGDIELANAFLEKGALVNPIPGTFSITPLYAATSNGHFEMVKFLIKKGADIHQTSPQQLYNTPLKMAVTCRHWDIFCYLLEHGADVNAKSEGTNTVLHEAASLAEYDMELSEKFIRKLMSAGINTKQKQKELTPFELATVLISNSDILRKEEKRIRIKKLAMLLLTPSTLSAQEKKSNTTDLMKKILEEKTKDKNAVSSIVPTLIKQSSVFIEKKSEILKEEHKSEESDFVYVLEEAESETYQPQGVCILM